MVLKLLLTIRVESLSMSILPSVLLQLPSILRIEPLATWIIPWLSKTATSMERLGLPLLPSAIIVPWLMKLSLPLTVTSLLMLVSELPRISWEPAPRITLLSPLTSNLAPGPPKSITELLMVWLVAMLRIAPSPKLALPMKVEPLVRVSLALSRVLRLRFPSTLTPSKTLLPVPTIKLPSSAIKVPPVIVPPLKVQGPVLLLKV